MDRYCLEMGRHYLAVGVVCKKLCRVKCLVVVVPRSSVGQSLKCVGYNEFQHNDINSIAYIKIKS